MIIDWSGGQWKIFELIIQLQEKRNFSSVYKAKKCKFIDKLAEKHPEILLNKNNNFFNREWDKLCEFSQSVSRWNSKALQIGQEKIYEIGQ